MTLKQLWNLRMSGKRPGYMVLLSMVGPLTDDAIVIDEKAHADADYRCLTNCCVVLVINQQTPAKLVKRVAESILRCAPNGGWTSFSRDTGYLWLYDIDRHDATMFTWTAARDFTHFGWGVHPENFEEQPLTRGVKRMLLEESFQNIERLSA